MAKRWIISLLVVALALASTALAASSETLQLSVPGSFETGMARSMLSLINAMRTGSDAWYWNENDTAKVVVSGLSNLTYDYGLEKVAMQRAAELAVRYSHTRPNGQSCFSAYPASLYASIGENIAYGYTGTQAMFDGWAEADEPYSGQGHRRNMLSGSFRSVGIGCFRHNGTLYWAQEFSSASSSDGASVLPTPVGVELLSGYVQSMGPPQEKLGLALNEQIPLSDLTVGLTVSGEYRPQTVNCVIEGMSWATSNSAVASLSGGKLSGKALGQATLTATAGSMSAQLPVKVFQPIGDINASVGGDQFFDSSGYATLQLTLPQIASVSHYRVNMRTLGQSSYSIYSSLQGGTRYLSVYQLDDVHPRHMTLEIIALDEDGYTLGTGTQRAVLYPISGVLNMPARLDTVLSEAFANSSAYSAFIPNGCRSIGSKAFANSRNLSSVRIPASVTSIASDAFNGCGAGLIIVAPANSKAAALAQSKGYTLFEID